MRLHQTASGYNVLHFTRSHAGGLVLMQATEIIMLHEVRHAGGSTMEGGTCMWVVLGRCLQRNWTPCWEFFPSWSTVHPQDANTISQSVKNTRTLDQEVVYTVTCGEPILVLKHFWATIHPPHGQSFNEFRRSTDGSPYTVNRVPVEPLLENDVEGMHSLQDSRGGSALMASSVCIL